MSIRMQVDIEDLRNRVRTLESRAVSKVESAAEDVVTVARKEWDALIARLEKLEARLRKV